ncbi:hypothetical protein F10086_209 [Staphylococcus phage vB_SauM_JDF86]|nr:hypothetical protein F10086_209 [Staphylococcus phage vB_SauM_JDF86]
MRNTLTNVIETLESKGYTIGYDETNTVLEIEHLSHDSMVDVTPIYLGTDSDSLFIIQDFEDCNLETMDFEITNYPTQKTVEGTTISELIKEIEESF